MKLLNVYKGFSMEDIRKLESQPFIEKELELKTNPLMLEDDYKRELMTKLMTFEGEYYITYEEFVLIEELGEEIIRLSEVKLRLIENDIYPGYYILPNNSSTVIDVIKKAYRYLNYADEETEIDAQTEKVLRFYGDIIVVDNNYFISYKNPELLLNEDLLISTITTGTNIEFSIDDLDAISSLDVDYIFEITTEVESFLRLVEFCKSNKHDTVGIKINDKPHFNTYFNKNFRSLINKFSYIKFYIIKDETLKKEYRAEFDDYLKDIWNYDTFKPLEVYKNPDEDKSVINVSQGQIIEDIVRQAEKAMSDYEYRDVFITAPTGAGKSVIFQIASLYIATKYRKVTIIISPLIALMKDQINNLKKVGIYNAAYINSELNFIEKEEVLQGIKQGEIDILYLAPETLLSYTIESFVGERDIGLFIVDEAHIVTTWGKGFRPDYWYLGKYLSRIRSGNNQFPIVTFTATAVYGGNDDMYDETIESLDMKSTLKYLGNIKRDDIKFDITNDLRKIGKEEYEQRKISNLSERLTNYLGSDFKSIVYFPFASTIFSISDRKEFEALKGSITAYTGKMNKDAKNISEEEFKFGNKKIMFATKAFGMGIDIKDINVVYHYAPTGNLNDYVQEIGRAARDKDITGYACIDFMNKDFDFIRMLYGMSSIKPFQAKAVLKKVYSIYTRRNKQNFLVTPNDFSFIFSGDSKKDNNQLERKLKTVLLMLEKDLEHKFGFPVLISRPKNMFSKAYVVIDSRVDSELLRSKYGKYFQRISNGRDSAREGQCLVSDVGDVYLFNLRGMWEDFYPQLSFASFKYQLLNKEVDFDFEYKDSLFLRYRISLKTNNNHKISDLKELLILEIEKINRILDNYKDNNKMFSVSEFKSEIRKIYSNEEKVSAIANSYIDLISPPDKNGRFIGKPIEYNSNINKYRIVNRGYNNAKRDLIIKSDLINKMKTDNTEFSLFHPKTKKKDFDLFRVLYLLELFELCNYEIVGGESPEIFIRLNDPMKIRKLTSEGFSYDNDVLRAVKDRNDNSTKIMRKFFTELDNDSERWEFIEDYFLGKDLIDEDASN